MFVMKRTIYFLEFFEHQLSHDLTQETINRYLTRERITISGETSQLFFLTQVYLRIHRQQQGRESLTLTSDDDSLSM